MRRISAECKYSAAVSDLFASSPVTVTVAIIGSLLLICAFFAFFLRYRYGLRHRNEFFIGAYKKDRGIIFFMVSLAIFIICFAASLIAFILLCIAFNIAAGIAFFVPNMATVAALFVLSAAIPFSGIGLAFKSVKN